jgi:phosphatidylglycerol:prolipoprotein diacylglycerol transferase
MFPLLVKLGPISIHSYGFFTAVGFLSGVYFIRKLSREAKVPEEKILDVTFWGLIVGFLGARILFIITRLPEFLAHPLDMFKVWEGGLVFMGAPFALVPYIYYFSKKHRLNVWRIFDVLIPGVTLAHSFGRIGCLGAGCCYGRPTDVSWGVKLHSELVSAHLRGVPLHPTQIYEAVALFILFLGLVWTARNKKFDGQVILTYFFAYPVIRSIIEIFRGDSIRGFVIQDILSTSQFISILFVTAAGGVLAYRLRQLRGKAGG